MHQIKKTFPWLLFSLPFLLLIWLQRNYSFTSLQWDDWGLVADRFPTDDLVPNLGGLMTPHSGHLIPLVKLSVILGIKLGQGDPRFLLIASMMITIGTGLLLLRLVRCTLPDRSLSAPLIVALAVASSIYSQVWLWWSCWPMFLPFFCVVLANYWLHGREFSWGRFASVMALSWIASYSQGAGGLVWLALLPPLMGFICDRSVATRRVAWSAYAVIGLTILRPFIMSALEGEGGSDKSLAERLVKMALYGLTVLGGSLGQGVASHSLLPSQIFGGLFSLAALALMIVAIRKRTVGAGVQAKLAPWISVVLFGLLSAAAIAAGRSRLPLNQALAGRYLLLTYPVWLGLYFAIRVIAVKGERSLFNWNWSRITLAATVALLLLQANIWVEGYRSIRLDYAEHLARVAPLNFSRLFPANPALKSCYPYVPPMLQIVERLAKNDRLHGLILYKSTALSEVGKARRLLPTLGGHLTSATTDPENRLLFEGYAYLYDSDRPADLILLTWESETHPDPQIFCLVSMPMRKDFYQSFERFRRPEKFTRWRVRLEPKQLPEGTGKIRCYAFDHKKKCLYRLRNAVTIKNGIITDCEKEAQGWENQDLKKRWPSSQGKETPFATPDLRTNDSE